MRPIRPSIILGEFAAAQKPPLSHPWLQCLSTACPLRTAVLLWCTEPFLFCSCSCCCLFVVLFHRCALLGWHIQSRIASEHCPWDWCQCLHYAFTHTGDEHAHHPGTLLREEMREEEWRLTRQWRHHAWMYCGFDCWVLLSLVERWGSTQPVRVPRPEPRHVTRVLLPPPRRYLITVF